jgi:N utilization substance protein B
VSILPGFDIVMMKITRRKAREKAVILLYQKDLLKKSPEEIVENDQLVGRKFDEFSLKLINGVTDNLKEIDGIIKATVQNWSLDRIAVIDRNILRLAIYEMIHEDDIPLKVSVDEAIEIAKSLGQKPDTPKFINGVLGKFLNDISDDIK